jgi:hypothetical protein
MKVVRNLTVKLTEAEWIECAEAMAKEQANWEDCDMERARAMAGFKSRMQEHEDNITRLAYLVRKRQKLTPVECQERLDFEAFKVSLYRVDTGEVLEIRDMTKDERQVKLPGMVPEDESARADRD